VAVVGVLVDSPSIGVVVATTRRPHLLRRALRSILAQDYHGYLRVVVVFDRFEPDWTLSQTGERPVTVMPNWRAPGRAGCRNTGILAVGDCDLVAFCGDDDTWAPDKLTAQVGALGSAPSARFVTCAVEVEYDGRRTPRLTGRRCIEVGDLASRRPPMLHSSGFLARHADLIAGPASGGIGLVAEDAPSQPAEDRDLLLRAAKRAPIAHVDRPLVRVLWRRPYDVDQEYARWVSALRWLMTRHPEIRESRRGAAWAYGQIACWEAAAGNRASAWRWARTALRASWREPRTVIAVAAAAGVIRMDRVLAALHRRDHAL
jgi:glycosyltransferase involved in cell wall biosynthesis